MHLLHHGSDIPAHPDGEVWLFAMPVGGGGVVFADSATSVLDFLIPGYGGLDDDEALHVRVANAASTAAVVQTAFIESATDAGFDLASQTEDALTALLTDKDVPVDGGPYDLDVPVVLVSTLYEPFTTRPKVGGNIVWLDPSTELAYVRSLAGAQVITLLVLAPPL